MNKKYDRENIGDLFQSAAFRREAIAAATGEPRPDKTPAALPKWRQTLLRLEQQIAQLPWQKLGRWMLMLMLAGASVWVWQQRGWLNDRITNAIAQATGATVQKIVVTGLTHTSQNELLKALKLGRGSSLVGFDAAAARARLEALPWIRLASVERQLPATVKVQIYEHIPRARVVSGSAVWVLNQQGVSVISDTNNQFAGLPLLQGEGAPSQAAALFEVLQSYPQLLSQLREATWVGQRRWDLRFASGVTVMLPEGRTAAGVALLKQLEEARHVLTLNDGVVDLRLADRIILRLPATVAVTPVTNQQPSPSQPNP